MVQLGWWTVLVVVLVVGAGGAQDAPAAAAPAQGGGVASGGERARRAPSGFLGMRGKKDGRDGLNLDEFDEAAAAGSMAEYPGSLDAAYPPMALGVPLRGKKAPSGFLGMRGKKSDEDDSSYLQTLLKRAPSGFLGMRGKKVPSGFLGVRGKKAPSGFTGMRGKKFYEDENNYDYDSDMENFAQALSTLIDRQLEKRAPSGFLGMRGKKAAYGYPDDTYQEMDMSKRAPSGFLGMRG